MASNNGQGKFKLTFLHPRDSSEFRAEIGSALTGDQVVKELVKAGFIDAASGRQAYAIHSQRTKTQIPLSAALGSSGVQDGDTLEVTAVSSGA